MKKLLLACLLLFAFEISSQSFTFTTDHTFLTDTLGKEIVFEFLVTNTSQETITMYVKRSVETLPETWNSSLCFAYCMAPFIDSIATTPEFGSNPIPPGETIDFSIHIQTGVNSGTGYVTLLAGNVNNRTDTMSVSLSAASILVGVNEENFIPSFRLMQNYPNPFNPSTEVMFEVDKAGYLTLELYNLNGEKVSTLLKGEYAPGLYSSRFNAQGLSSGVYLLKLNSGNRSRTIKILLEK
jgi:hypothetical protein